jgi:hypothetical protein
VEKTIAFPKNICTLDGYLLVMGRYHALFNGLLACVANASTLATIYRSGVDLFINRVAVNYGDGNGTCVESNVGRSSGVSFFLSANDMVSGRLIYRITFNGINQVCGKRADSGKIKKGAIYEESVRSKKIICI